LYGTNPWPAQFGREHCLYTFLISFLFFFKYRSKQDQFCIKWQCPEGDAAPKEPLVLGWAVYGTNSCSTRVGGEYSSGTYFNLFFLNIDQKTFFNWNKTSTGLAQQPICAIIRAEIEKKNRKK
jgi:hypothetical protein